MAPKKTIAEQLRSKLSPARGEPEEDCDDDQGEFRPPLNQQGAVFDKIVRPPFRKEKHSASSSASEASTLVTSDPHDDFILRQSAQQEQLKHLFSLVTSLGSKIE